MKFLRKIFGKKQEYNNNENEEKLLQQLLDKFSSMNLKDFEKIESAINQTEVESQKLESLKELFDAGKEYNKEYSAVKIINEYGNAITLASEINKRKVQEFFKNSDANSKAKFLNDKYDIYYRLQNKFDLSLLPYKKETIKQALVYLLKIETNQEKKEQLKTGLLYLKDFIDYDKFKSHKI